MHSNIFTYFYPFCIIIKMGACIGEPKTKKSKIAGEKKIKKEINIEE